MFLSGHVRFEKFSFFFVQSINFLLTLEFLTKKKCTKNKNTSILNLGLNLVYFWINLFIVLFESNSNVVLQLNWNWKIILCTKHFINCWFFFMNAIHENHSHLNLIGWFGKCLILVFGVKLIFTVRIIRRNITFVFDSISFSFFLAKSNHRPTFSQILNVTILVHCIYFIKFRISSRSKM